MSLTEHRGGAANPTHSRNLPQASTGANTIDPGAVESMIPNHIARPGDLLTGQLNTAATYPTPDGTVISLRFPTEQCDKNDNEKQMTGHLLSFTATLLPLLITSPSSAITRGKQ